MKKYLWHIIAIAVVIVWGVTFVSSKVLLAEGLGPAEILVLRFIIAYICMLPFSFGKRGKLFADNLLDELLLAALGITGGSMYFLLENTALEYTQASNVSILITTTPLLTMLASAIFIRDGKVSAHKIICALISMAGVVMVVLNGEMVLKLHPLGDLLTLGAALMWVVYSLLIRRFDGRYSVALVTRKVFFYGLITILPYFIRHPWGVSAQMLMQPVVAANLLFLGLIASFLCFLAWNAALKRIGPVAANLYLFINPIATALVAIPVLNERFTWISILGSLLILAGLFLSQRISE